MNFDEAVAAHVKWKTRLRMFINGGTEKLDSAVVSKDNACDLGKWIYGEATRYKSNPSYDVLRTEHANFHRCAAAVVKKMESGDKAGAETLLETGEFSTASNRTVSAILQMKKAVSSG